MFRTMICLLLVSLPGAAIAAAPFARLRDVPQATLEVNLVAMGDWAASGKSQVPVARCLADYVEGSAAASTPPLRPATTFTPR